MAVVTTKSPSIINWDASPIFIPTIGEGAEGVLRVNNDSLAAASGDSIASIYRLCRIPTNSKVKRVLLNSPTIATGGAGDIDVAFSDSATDGTQPALAGGIVQVTGPVDNKLFGSAQSLISPQKQVDVTFNGTFLLAHQNIPLWAVLVALGATQFVTDPGGFFDLVIKLTTGITTGGNVGLEVDFVE